MQTQVDHKDMVQLRFDGEEEVDCLTTVERRYILPKREEDAGQPEVPRLPETPFGHVRQGPFRKKLSLSDYMSRRSKLASVQTPEP